MNITEETIKQIESFVGVTFFKGSNPAEAKDADSLRLGFFQEDETYCGIDIKSTKKEITFERILAEIEKRKIKIPQNPKIFELLAKMSQIADYTTYGLSLFTMFQKEERESILDNFLDGLGIKYSKEYSEAHFVLRYKISKSKENLDLIANIEKG